MHARILSFLGFLPFLVTTEHSLCYPGVTYWLSFFPKFIFFWSHFSLLISAFRGLTLSFPVSSFWKGPNMCIFVLIFYHISCDPMGISTKMPCCFFKYRCENPSFISPHPQYPHFCLWHPLCKQAPKLGRLPFFLSSLILKPWNTPRLGSAMGLLCVLPWNDSFSTGLSLSSGQVLPHPWLFLRLLWIIFIFLLSHDCF